MENPRTDAARDHDDSALIDNFEPGASQGGTSGGNLARDVTSEADLSQVGEPEASTRVRKDHDIQHAQEQRTDRARAPDNGS